MPPTKALKPEVMDIFERWVAAGAPNTAADAAGFGTGDSTDLQCSDTFDRDGLADADGERHDNCACFNGIPWDFCNANTIAASLPG